MYFQHYIDYISLRAFLKDNRSTLNTSSELDKFFHGLTYATEIFRVSCEERMSVDPAVQRKFTQGAIVTTLTQYLNDLRLLNDSSSSSQSKHDDSDSDSDYHVPRRCASSRFSGLRDSARTTSLSCSNPLSSNKKKKKKTTTRRAHVMKIDVNDPLASLFIPEGLQQEEIF